MKPLRTAGSNQGVSIFLHEIYRVAMVIKNKRKYGPIVAASSVQPRPEVPPYSMNQEDL